MWARSYVLRAVLAVGLFALFYGFSIGLALGLAALPYWIYLTSHHVSYRLAIGCVLGALAILWGIAPRWRRFRPPGPQLLAEDQPRLFARVRAIAQQMGAEMPKEVYLIPDVNAFVALRGGLMGLGGRRVLGLGLGLLAVDNVSQLDATLAHEFGHFFGGETRLNRFIHQTRTAMIRTQETLRASGNVLLHRPFQSMVNLYLRLTQAVSRQQELLSDEWSVRIAGKEAHISGLRAEGLHGAAFRLYLRQEVDPLAEGGLAPDNLFEGFRQYTQSSTWAQRSAGLREIICRRTSDPYDSHPSLEERVAFAQQLELPDQPMDPTPAHTLLENPERLERQFSEWLRPSDLRPIAWSEAAQHWSERWRKTASRLQSSLPTLTIGGVGALLRDTSEVERIALSVYPELEGALEEDRRRHAPGLVRHAVSTYLGAVLSQHGFSWRTGPGDPIELIREGRRIDPVQWVEGFEKGEHSLEALLEGLGIPGASAMLLESPPESEDQSE